MSQQSPNTYDACKIALDFLYHAEGEGVEAVREILRAAIAKEDGR